MQRNPLRARLRANETAVGCWVTMESAAVTEIAVALGLDWITVDMEHGHLDHKDVMDHLRAARGSDTSVIVRVPSIDELAIRRVLDMGAHGVILPMVRSREDLERAHRYGRYPPAGIRGVGGERAVKWGLGFDEYLAIADEETMLIPLIESADAVDAIDEILAVEGIEAVFLGPADLSASLGHVGAWEAPGAPERIAKVRERATARGVAAGIMGRDVADARARRDQGFRMVGLGSDTGLIIRGLREALKALGRDEARELWL